MLLKLLKSNLRKNAKNKIKWNAVCESWQQNRYNVKKDNKIGKLLKILNPVLKFQLFLKIHNYWKSTMYILKQRSTTLNKKKFL